MCVHDGLYVSPPSALQSTLWGGVRPCCISVALHCAEYLGAPTKIICQVAAAVVVQSVGAVPGYLVLINQ